MPPVLLMSSKARRFAAAPPAQEAPLPSWVPAAGALATLTNTNGLLTNHFRDVVPAGYDSFYSVSVVNDYGGAVKNPHFGTYGAQHFWGSGHASGSNDNGVYSLVYGADDCTFELTVSPTDWESEVGGNNDGANPTLDASLIATPWLESTIDGKPLSPHHWQSQFIQGPADGGATYGTMWSVVPLACGHQDYSATAAYKLPFTSTTPNTATWARASSSSTYPRGFSEAPGLCAYASGQQRAYRTANSSATSLVQWFDMVTGDFETGSGTNFGVDAMDGGGDVFAVTFPVPERDLIVCAGRVAGVLAIKYMDVSVADPTVVSATLSNASLGLNTPWSTACWCPDNSRIIVGGISGDDAAVYEVTIPADPTDTWTLERAAFPEGQTWAIDEGTFANARGKFGYDERVRAIVFLLAAKRTGDDSVTVYRPRGT